MSKSATTRAKPSSAVLSPILSSPPIPSVPEIPGKYKHRSCATNSPISSSSSATRIGSHSNRKYVHIKSKVGRKANTNHTPDPPQILQRTKSLPSSYRRPDYRPPAITELPTLWVTSAGEKQHCSHVKSKVGSLDNIKHKPGGGNVKLFEEKVTVAAKSKIGSLDNIEHKPGGGNVKLFEQKLSFDNAKSKVGSKDNIKHKPGGGNAKVFDEKIVIEAKSKVGSKDNIKHKPGGGLVKIFDEKVLIEAKPKVGSKDNIKHKPGGGLVKIFDEKVLIEAKPKVGSKDNIKHKPGGGGVKVHNEKATFSDESKIGSRNNLKQKLGGVNIKLFERKLAHDSPKFKTDSIDHITRTQSNGLINVYDEAVIPEAVLKTRLFDNDKHRLGGEDVIPLEKKLAFEESAKIRIGVRKKK